VRTKHFHHATRRAPRIVLALSPSWISKLIIEQRFSRRISVPDFPFCLRFRRRSKTRNGKRRRSGHGCAPLNLDVARFNYDLRHRRDFPRRVQQNFLFSRLQRGVKSVSRFYSALLARNRRANARAATRSFLIGSGIRRKAIIHLLHWL